MDNAAHKALILKVPMKKEILLSKSRILHGIQCQKFLYLEIFRKDLADPVSESTQSRFDEGNEVGLEAQRLFPQGVVAETDYTDPKGSFEKTLKLISEGATTLFEATIIFENALARADILHKNENGMWEIIEVKSATSVQDKHLDDAAIQLWIFRAYGLKIEKISILHVNTKPVAPVKVQDLFTKLDVTKEVEKRLPKIPSLIKEMFEVLEAPEPPKIDIGPQCTSPYDCAFISHCWKHIPTPSAFNIPNIGKKIWKIYPFKSIEIKDLDEKDFQAIQLRVVQAHKTGKRFVDKKYILNQLKNWKWPIYFLDFETSNPAIPIYDGVHPYQRVPFQFSCHILEKLDADVKHFEYLHLDKSDPRESLARTLAEGFGPTGSVVAYNKSVEGGILEELAELFPKYRESLKNIARRLVDPWPILKEAVYDVGFNGSFSLKSVAPALLGATMSYSNLEVSEGLGASNAYLSLTKGNLSTEEKAKLIQAMLKYCRQDTLATVGLVKWLFEN
jgi:predicted RecB family nuclease